ncbi:MAG: OsmC family peroxiredoxin [Bacteroidales bacterium]
MRKTKANAVWNGTLKKGNGTFKLPLAGAEINYTYASRFESGKESNPEELIGAALSGCFSQALSLEMEKAGYEPETINTEAEVTLAQADGGHKISDIHLKTRVKAGDIPEDKFQELASGSKENCPVSKALAGVNIHLDAELV